MKFDIRITCLMIVAVLTGGGCSTTSGTGCADGHCEAGLFQKMFGCDACERSCDFSYAAIPQPVGTSVRMHNQLQEQHAEESDFVVYQHEWYQGGLSLGPAGRRHVKQLAHRMAHEPFQVVVEPMDPDLKVDPDIDVAVQEARNTDEQRRVILVELLLESGVTDADSRVVIDWPHAEGLRGDEASRVFGRLNQGGRGGGAFGGGGGGFGGGGTGGGGFGGGGFGGGGGGFGGGGAF